jgi:peroxiredoxin
MEIIDPTVLPPGLPVPTDDGAARHLAGLAVPDLALPSTGGADVELSRPGTRPRTILYAYPWTVRPGEAPLAEDWDLIPGARGCTPQACAFREHHADLAAAGADVYGLSTQDLADQAEVVQRLHLPFALLCDADLRLTRALGLPTFEVAGRTLLRRLTLVLRGGHVEHVFYPVFPPNTHAGEVLRWLGEHPIAAG